MLKADTALHVGAEQKLPERAGRRLVQTRAKHQVGRSLSDLRHPCPACPAPLLSHLLPSKVERPSQGPWLRPLLTVMGKDLVFGWSAWLSALKVSR